MFKLITKLTDLELAHMYSEDEEDSEETPTQGISNACCTTEVRRWQHGCYTLVHDGDPCGEEYALDALIYFGCDGKSGNASDLGNGKLGYASDVGI